MNLFTYLPILSHTYALGIGLCLTATASVAQTQTKTDTTVYVIVEKQPEFPGGMSALSNYLKMTVNYPPEAKKAGIKGLVLVSFVIDPDGSFTDIYVRKGLGYGCDEEALRAIQTMPCWFPGSQSGRLLRVKYTLPIAFGIDFPKRKGH